MKKVLHISKYYFPFRGGTEAVAQDIAEGCVGEFENKVIAFNHEAGDSIDVINGIEIYRAGCFAKIASQSLSFSYRKILKRLFKSWQPDIVHFHLPNVFVMAILLDILPKDAKLVLHWHLDIVKQKLIYTFIKPLETKLLKRADAVVVTSHKYLEDSTPLVPYRDKVRVIYNGIQTDRLEKRNGDDEKIEKLLASYGDKKIVFFIGRHVPYKGLKYLIEAETMIQEECVILVAGEGPLTEELKAQANLSRVNFLGKLSEEELRIHLHAATIFAFPSITKNEAFGLALAEGMYCHCVPVTFTIVGSGVNEVSINGETGLEVENGNAMAYAQAIDCLLRNNDLTKTLAVNSYERVKNLFTVEQEQNMVSSLYFEIV